jgi:hypothetical protein
VIALGLCYKRAQYHHQRGATRPIHRDLEMPSNSTSAATSGTSAAREDPRQEAPVQCRESTGKAARRDAEAYLERRASN